MRACRRVHNMSVYDYFFFSKQQNNYAKKNLKTYTLMYERYKC